MRSSLICSGICVLVFAIHFKTYSQIGIATTNPQALLDISVADPDNPSATDGILIPKVNVLPATPPGAGQEGMLVYLTTDDGEADKGFHCWDNSSASWICLNSEWKKETNPGGAKVITVNKARNNGNVIAFTENGELGLGTNDPQEQLHTTGDIRVDNLSAASHSAISFPARLYADANGKLLVTNTAGIYGEIYNETLYQTISNTAYTQIQFGTTGDNNRMSTGTHTLTVNATGTYRINYAVTITKTGGGVADVYFGLTTGTNVNVDGVAGSTSVITVDKNSGFRDATRTSMVNLSAGQTIYLYAFATDSGVQTQPIGTYLTANLID